MKISQQFTVARPLADVWAFFQDVPAVARCMPGAELTEDKGDGLYAGKVKAKLGPFGASFEGEAQGHQRRGHGIAAMSRAKASTSAAAAAPAW